MKLEKLVKELSKFLEKYPNHQVVFDVRLKREGSVRVCSVFTETYSDNQQYIVLSNEEGRSSQDQILCTIKDIKG